MATAETNQPLPTLDPAEWVDQYGDMLLSYALSRINDRELAEDLVQETFLVAWKNRSSFSGRSLFSTWLVSILKRKVADHFRRETKKKSYSLDQQDQSDRGDPHFNKKGKWLSKPTAWKDSPEELAENREFWKTVALCLDGIPAHLAYVFRLRELKSAKTKEICSLLDISSANMSVRLHRARLLLRQCLENKWFDH